MSRFTPSVVVLAVLSTFVGSLAAAQPGSADARWAVVLTDRNENIALDTTRVSRGLRGTTAWSRINLGREVADMGGSYNAIEAENLYECSSRKFTTLRRIYFKDGTSVREEAAVRERANRVMVGSIDERLLDEACKVQPASEAVASPEQGAKPSNLASSLEEFGGDRPNAMLADMRTLGSDKSGARALKVSDAPPGEKPRMIELPKIDREAAAREAAAAGVGGGAAKPTPATAKAPDIHSAAAAASSVAPKAVPAIPDRVLPTTPAHGAASAAKAPANLHTTDTGMSGHARELMLATSGPKKVAKKKEANPAHDMHVHWGYDGAGAPANWGKLDPKNGTCDTGKRQSPIDIRPGIQVDLEEIKFNYKRTKFNVFDNGHTIQVNVGAGSTINVGGKRFELAQFHFHKPSEERVNGRPYPMVIHFVHKDWDDNLAVIAVLLDEGPEHPALQTVWNNMPLEPNSEVIAQDILEPIQFFPDNRAYWTYMGSLTTPPCTENVLWMVMKNPTLVSPEQIGIFGRLYKNNARPIQPSNGRLIKETR